MRKFEVYLPMSEGQEYDFIELEADDIVVSNDFLIFTVRLKEIPAGPNLDRTTAIFKDWSHFVEVIQKDED